MCTGKCSHCIAVTLYPLVVISIICNIVLFFPAGKVQYAREGHITDEVKYMGGLVGGGIMMLFPALYIHMTGTQGLCANRCGMLLSISFASVGAAGALYSFCVAALGLHKGPLCKDSAGDWTRPFSDSTKNYLTEQDNWAKCIEPKNIVQFNAGLFITLMAISFLQGLLCVIQAINGLIGCLCGACLDKESA